jgi:hypothetical protein
MASTLKDAVMYQCHLTSVRTEKAYVGILTPRQTILYQEWLSNRANMDRCKDVLAERRDAKGASSTNSKENACLLDVCRKLEETLKISQEQQMPR